VAEVDVRRRYHRGLALFEHAYKPLVDEWYHSIATTTDFALASTRKNERTSPKRDVLVEAARRAAWDALHGPSHLRAGRFRAQAGGPFRDDAGGAPQQGAAADSAPRRC
jgi:hypothetical protein